MTGEQDTELKQIIDMSDIEKLAAMGADPVEYYQRAYGEERVRAADQVQRQIARRLGASGLNVGNA